MFENSNDIHLLSVPSDPRRHLILIRAGSKRRPSFFSEIPQEEREYDLAVNYYATPHQDDILRSMAEIVFAGGRSKMHGAKRFIYRTYSFRA
ncbi:hypothetical protein [Mesorhizobium sp. B2-3-10]|uniref:hypothetical protein n=1 Tax=Mesorhizobium sp. B2-3-10 TaxID=2589954 RepID=UPI00112BF5FD|nr:hypothetical protein [Mesorhizobium sp. B2-3-10]TPL99805.1 hypothetical protein FJ943_15465 [Mesorhizobium sp. B2-3-10]